jgi:hypothetical protein
MHSNENHHLNDVLVFRHSAGGTLPNRWVGLALTLLVRSTDRSRPGDVAVRTHGWIIAPNRARV